MSSRLVNVRLDEEHYRRARKLREQGVTLSEVVREAIDERYEAIAKPTTAREATRILDRVFEQHPDPPDLPARTYDVHDRTQARDAIRRKLRRKPR